MEAPAGGGASSLEQVPFAGGLLHPFQPVVSLRDSRFAVIPPETITL
jgi:hypothetical protein